MKRILSALGAVMVCCIIASAAVLQEKTLSKTRLSSVSLSEMQFDNKKATRTEVKLEKPIQKSAIVRKAQSNVRRAAETQTITATLIASECGFSNAESIDGNYLTNTNETVYIGFEKGSGTTAPAYYDSGASVRIYSGNQVVIGSQYSNVIITDVQFELNVNYQWSSAPVVSSGNYDLATQSWSGAANEVSFTTSQKVYINKIIVTAMVVTEDDDPATLPYFSFDKSEWSYIGEGEFKDAWFNILWSTGVAASFEVKVYQSKKNPSQYLLENPYGTDTPYAEVNESSEAGYIVFDVTDPECVLVRPYTYAMTLSMVTAGARWCCTNYEGLQYYINGLSYDEVKAHRVDDGLEAATYDSTTGVVTFNNACLTISNSEEYTGIYQWNNSIMEGYLILPGHTGGSGVVSHSVEVEYMAADNVKTATMQESSNGDFECEISNADWFNFVIDDANVFYVNLNGTNLGEKLPLVTSLETGDGCTYTPWKGNYKIAVSADFSTAKITTGTPKPSTIDIYLTGDYNNWAYDNVNKFQQKGNGEFTFTVPADINTAEGGWRISTPEERFSYSYSGAVNPADTYQFTPHSRYVTTLPLSKGDVINLSFNTDRYTDPATVSIVRADNSGEEPPVSGSSKTVDINGVIYTLYPGEGYMMATDGSKAKGDVALVASTEGLSLRGVATGAFKDNGEIWTITVPEGAVSIGNEAFSGCMNLQEVTLPSTLTTIGRYAFLECSYIASFSLPAGVKNLGIGAFQNCTDLELFKFNQAVIKEIPDALFEGCARLQDVEIPTTVTKIGANAFLGAGIVKIGATNNVTAVGDRAFEESKLAQFDFDNVATIGVGAFNGTLIKSAELTSKLTSLGEQAFLNCKNLAKVTLSNKIQSIGKSTFEDCHALTSIEIPASVTQIMDKAFYNSGLVTVVVGDKVTSLGANAFVTESLTAITLGSGITKLDNTPLSTQGMLRLNNSTPPILGSNRLDCTPTVVIVPKGAGATYLSNSRWKNYNIVEEGDEVIIYLSAPGALTADLRMKQKLAAQVTSLVVVTNPDKGTLNDTDWKAIKSNMTSLIKLDISDADVKNIPDDCFKNKKILTQIVLPKNLETIGKSAFEGCALLESITLPSTVTSIGERAFAGCNSMAGNLVIPAGCKTLGAESFMNCYALDNVIINSASLKEIEKSVFENCRNLDSVTLPVGIVTIGEKAFAETGILTVNFPEGLTGIEANAFEGCFYLTNVNLPASLRTIGTRAFARSGLIGVTLPSNISVMEDETFDACDDLRYINLPSQLTTLGSRAVASPSVSAISSPAQVPPTAGYSPFDGINNYTCTLSIPAFSYNEYISAEYWGAFVSVHDNIDVSIQGNPDVTYTDEEDYQSLMRSMSLNVRGKKVRNVAAAPTVEPSNFGKLFNGAQMFVPEKVATRFFFLGDLSGYTVEYNGKDVTAEIDKSTKSWLAPEMSGSARLKITNTNAASIDEISVYGSCVNNDVYNVAGVLIIKDATADQIENLAPGFYIIGGKKFLVK